MNPTTANHQYRDILQTVRSWPPDLRFDLLQALLQTFAPEPEESFATKETWSKAFGLLDVGGVMPSDDEVKQWLDERRLERFG